MQQDKPLPPVNADTAPFWEACQREELLYQRCRACARVQPYPRALCCGCQGRDLAWETARGLGRIASFSLVHRAPTPAFRAEVPYLLALVDLDEGPRLMLNLPGCDPQALRIGARVRVVFETRGPDGFKLPQARLAEESC